jgi:hypothetical protein
VGSTTLFLLFRGSPSIRSIACLFTEVTDVVLVENHAGSFGCFRAASGLVDLGELGIGAGRDMDMVVNSAESHKRATHRGRYSYTQLTSAEIIPPSVLHCTVSTILENMTERLYIIIGETS